MIKTAGSGYTLKIVVIDVNGFAVAGVTSSTFSVAVGPIFKLQFYVAIGSAIGGQLINPDPRVSVVDRGGNVVTGITGATCSAYLSQSPTSTEILYPLIRVPAIFESGIATFTGFYINKAGFPYQISFNASTTGVRFSRCIVICTD